MAAKEDEETEKDNEEEDDAARSYVKLGSPRGFGAYQEDQDHHAESGADKQETEEQQEAQQEALPRPESRASVEPKDESDGDATEAPTSGMTEEEAATTTADGSSDADSAGPRAQGVNTPEESGWCRLTHPLVF